MTAGTYLYAPCMADAERARRIAGCVEASDRVLVDLVQKPRDRTLLETRVVFMVRERVRNTRPQAKKNTLCTHTLGLDFGCLRRLSCTCEYAVGGV